VSATTLHGTVHSGDKLEAFFTIAKGCTGIPVTLVSHTMPDAVFVPAHADQQKVFDLATGTFDSGDHTLGPVNVPSCFFQVDFVYGGVHGSGYHVQDHTYSSGTGGTTACSTTPATPPTTTAAPATTVPGAQVLPVVITAPAAPAKAAPAVLAQQAGPLARTGSNTGFLLWFSFALMLLGGLITVTSQRVARQS
jgi:hypothetical protein